jgi:hypothetical protein
VGPSRHQPRGRRLAAASPSDRSGAAARLPSPTGSAVAPDTPATLRPRDAARRGVAARGHADPDLLADRHERPRPRGGDPITAAQLRRTCRPRTSPASGRGSPSGCRRRCSGRALGRPGRRRRLTWRRRRGNLGSAADTPPAPLVGAGAVLVRPRAGEPRPDERVPS